MSFFSSIGGFFKGIGKGIKSGFTSIYKKVIEPVGKFAYNKILKPVYSKVIKPIGKKILSIGSKGVNAVEHVVDSGVKVVDAVGTGGVKLIDGVGSAASGLGSLLSNPIAWLAGGAAALIVVNKMK